MRQNQYSPVLPLSPYHCSVTECTQLMWYFSNFFFQDSPDQGALHLVRGLLNVVQEYTWEINSGAKMSIYLNAVCLLSAMSQVGLCVIVSVWYVICMIRSSSRGLHEHTRESRAIVRKRLWLFFPCKPSFIEKKYGWNFHLSLQEYFIYHVDKGRLLSS